MKKFMFLLLTSVFFTSCTSYQQDLDKMGQAVKSHFKYRDADNGTITKITYLEPLSYETIPEDKRKKEDEAYLFKAYVKGTWKYPESSLIYNIDDTVKCYFSSKKVFLRMEEKK
ncbi:MAG: hypothetical protein E6767_16555 [Dysgonomonas sp.]|nr:hypothetical protein [Dysgonomonas sp.]